MAINNENYWPLGSTIQKTFTNLQENSLFRNSQTSISNNNYLPFGHIIDIGNNVLYQTWYAYDTVEHYYSVYLYKSVDGGLTFNTIKIIYEGYMQYSEPSIVNVGGGCFIALIRINNSNVFRQFISEDNFETWTPPNGQGDTSFEVLSGVQSPPFLTYINFEGLGIVACYYTNRGANELKVVFAFASKLLNDGPDAWGNPTDPSHLPVINVIKENFGENTSYVNSGYQSFFHPKKQFNGIGLGFADINYSIAYPEIFFTNLKGNPSTYVNLIEVINNLGI
jgi:hypothetical protein